MKIRSVFLRLALLLTAIGPSISVFALLPGDEHWDNKFGPAGLNSTAAGIAVMGGKVYAAGSFVTAAGNTRANGVAGFDGTNWFQLNGGLMNNTAVIAVNTDGQYLYVSGIFANADDPTAFNSARWDGTNWSTLGGITGLTYAHKKSGNNLYVGGAFTKAGGQGITNIARWDGTNWFSLGSGITNNGLGTYGVTTIAIQGNNIYAGGVFPAAGNAAAIDVAYYDGSTWHAMGNPFPSGGVLALTFVGNTLYAGGYFTNGTLGITNIARWNGSIWSALPGNGPNNRVYDLATDGTNLFVGGMFTQIGGIPASNVAKFDGTNWTALGGGLHFFQNALGQVNKLFWSSNQLYVAGGFDMAGSIGCANVARWDGTNWWSLGGDTSKGFIPSLNSVLALDFLNFSANLPSGLYAAGLFTAAGKTNATEIAYFDGDHWNAVGGGVEYGSQFSIASSVRALASDGFSLYVGGNFTNAAGVTASDIAQWNGSSWSPLGSGVDSSVNAIVVGLGNYLWVGGIFTNSGAGYSRGLSTYVSGTWYNLGNVEGANTAVNALAYDGNDYVFVGGNFVTAGGVNATNIAYFNYNDFSFHPLGLGFDAKVNALAYANGFLYAGGSFTKSGATTLNHIAKWDGTTWSPLGTGLIGTSTASVSAIAVTGNNIYVTGAFTNAGGIIVSNVAKWDGTAWSAMGNGTELGRAASAVAASGDDVYVGGNFNFAGDKPSQFIAHWNAQTNYYPTANMLLTRTAWQTNRQVRFRVTGTSGQRFIIQASTNFNAWTSLLTNSTMFFDYSDTNSSLYTRRFYRTLLGQ